MPYGFGSFGLLDQGADTTPEHAKQPSRNPHIDALAEALLKHYSESAPTAPMPPSFQGLPPLKAAAAALNPQLTQTLISNEMSPDVARYQQAQQQFEAAMQGRGQALAAGTSLLNAQTRAESLLDAAGLRASNKPAVADKFQREVDGVRHTFRVILDPITKLPMIDPETSKPYEFDLGPDPFAPAIMPVTTVDEKTGEKKTVIATVPRGGGGRASVVSGPPGTTLEAPTPPGLAQEAGGKAGVIQRFPGIMDAFDKAAADLGPNPGVLAQWKNYFQSKAARTGVGPILAPASLVNYYRDMRSALFPIVKAGSGAVFPEAELARWESRFPIPGVDTPGAGGTAEKAWNSLIDEIITDIKSKFGAVGRTPPPMERPVVGGTGPSPEARAFIESLKKKP